MKKKNVTYEEREENAFALSTGDLMAGLLFIFILLLMSAMLQVQEKAEQDEEIVKKYDQIKTQLYIDLQEEFKEDLTVWRATIDSTLCIRFQEPSMLFDNNQAYLKPRFKEILKRAGEKYRLMHEYYTVNSHGNILKIPLSDIYYAESYKKHLLIHTQHLL